MWVSFVMSLPTWPPFCQDENGGAGGRQDAHYGGGRAVSGQTVLRATDVLCSTTVLILTDNSPCSRSQTDDTESTEIY